MTRIRSGAVQVEGLAELSRALKQLEDIESRREIRMANKTAADYVAGHARDRAYSLGSTAGHVAPSIKASAGYQSAGVAFGGSGFPMAMGAEFGGQRRKTTQQFEPWRGSDSDAGYFLYPTIRERADEIVEPYKDAIQELLARIGLAA